MHLKADPSHNFCLSFICYFTMDPTAHTLLASLITSNQWLEVVQTSVNYRHSCNCWCLKWRSFPCSSTLIAMRLILHHWIPCTALINDPLRGRDLSVARKAQCLSKLHPFSSLVPCTTHSIMLIHRPFAIHSGSHCESSWHSLLSSITQSDSCLRPFSILVKGKNGTTQLSVWLKRYTSYCFTKFCGLVWLFNWCFYNSIP